MKSPATIFVLSAPEKWKADAVDERGFRCRFHGIKRIGFDQRRVYCARIVELHITRPTGGNCSGLLTGNSSSPCWMPSWLISLCK
jgi:hypothetical protein